MIGNMTGNLVDREYDDNRHTSAFNSSDLKKN